MDILSIPGFYRCSIGFLIPFSNEKLEKYFKKEGYKVSELPESTRCVQCEFPYRLDIPPAYPMITMKTNAPMRNFLHHERISDSRECCLEVYYRQEKKVVIYVPTEHYD